MSENAETELLNCGKGERILIVDDSRVNRLILKTRLTQAGYEVIEAQGGEEALPLLGLQDEDEAKAGPAIDVVVLDIMMPDIDGLQVLQRIREKRSANELPVIMATSKDQSADIVGALAQGSNDYVTKPIDLPVLLARLRTQVSLRKTHLALKQAQQSLIEAAKMESVGYLAAGVAHEVRNPLAKIQMGVEAIKMSDAVQEDESLNRAVEIVTTAVEQADGIVRALMNVSTSGRLELKEGSITQLLEEAIQSVAGKANEVNIITEFIDSQPSVAFAKTEFTQVMIGLLQNAIDSMPDGGTVIVRTRQTLAADGSLEEGRSGRRLRAEDEVLEISVIDTGSGISEGNLQKVFDPFFTTRPTGQGTGLGLSVARKVIELHQGDISIANRHDAKGAQATILLPLSTSIRQII